MLRITPGERLDSSSGSAARFFCKRLSRVLREYGMVRRRWAGMRRREVCGVRSVLRGDLKGLRIRDLSWRLQDQVPGNPLHSCRTGHLYEGGLEPPQPLVRPAPRSGMVFPLVVLVAVLPGMAALNSWDLTPPGPMRLLRGWPFSTACLLTRLLPPTESSAQNFMPQRFRKRVPTSRHFMPGWRQSRSG